MIAKISAEKMREKMEASLKRSKLRLEAYNTVHEWIKTHYSNNVKITQHVKNKLAKTLGKEFFISFGVVRWTINYGKNGNDLFSFDLSNVGGKYADLDDDHISLALFEKYNRSAVLQEKDILDAEAALPKLEESVRAHNEMVDKLNEFNESVIHEHPLYYLSFDIRSDHGRAEFEEDRKL